MADRKENLRKINAELEELSDEELEHVTGGTLFIRKLEADSSTTFETLEAPQPDPDKFPFLFN